MNAFDAYRPIRLQIVKLKNQTHGFCFLTHREEFMLCMKPYYIEVYSAKAFLIQLSHATRSDYLLLETDAYALQCLGIRSTQLSQICEFGSFGAASSTQIMIIGF